MFFFLIIINITLYQPLSKQIETTENDEIETLLKELGVDSVDQFASLLQQGEVGAMTYN